MIRASLTTSVAAVLLLATASTGFALTIPVLPNGMCALDTSVPAEKAMYDYLANATAQAGSLVKVFADCNELKALTTGKIPGVSHYGTIIRQTALGNISIPRAEFLTAAGSLYQGNDNVLNQALAGVGGTASAATKKADLVPATKIDATSNGVLYQDPNVVVMGLQQTHQINGKPFTVLSTVGLTLIGGSPVSVNLYAPASETGAQDKAVTSLKAYVSGLVKANP